MNWAERLLALSLIQVIEAIEIEMTWWEFADHAWHGDVPVWPEYL